MSLHVSSFAGGVVLSGSPDAQSPSEITVGDSVDLGPRGQLVAASDVTDYLVLDDNGTPPVPWTKLHALLPVAGATFSNVLAVGEGQSSAGVVSYLFAAFNRLSATDPLAFVTGQIFGNPSGLPAVRPEGVLVTACSFPGVFNVRYAAPGGGPGAVFQPVNVTLVNIGAREGFAPNVAPGLYALSANPLGATQFANAIVRFDALGTGSSGLFTVPTINGGEGQAVGGTKGKQLRFRGIIAFNNHVFGWGFDSKDATNGDGPARVMFSNLGAPLKWGNDNLLAVGTDRAFSDSDAIVLGDAGEIVRGAYAWNRKLFFGTNQQLHFIGGYGRDSFLTDGAAPLAKSHNIVGPHAMVEGPDTALYGVSDQGLWKLAPYSDYQLPSFEPVFLKLTDFNGRSAGYWDCIWTDPTRVASSYPGQTNQDLVWTAADWDRQQVVIGVPWCDATAGGGYGTDTVVIRYHVRGGGFTRQVFPGQQFTAAAFLRHQAQQQNVRLMGTATAARHTVQYYGATSSGSPVMPASPEQLTFGPYAPFGPDGDGVVRRLYLTLAWESAAALPLVFQVTTTVDASPVDLFLLTIAPTAPAGPAAGDLWLDTSQTDQSIGNAVAGLTVQARGGYLLKSRSVAGTWRLVPGEGGSGRRATLPLPLTRLPGTRLTLTMVRMSAGGRYQIEGIASEPGTGTPEQT